MDSYFQFIPDDLIEKYDFFNYNHAVEILANSFPVEWDELVNALRNLHITKEELIMAGGSESPIPPKLNAILDPLGWKEIKITGDLLIKVYPRKGARGKFASEPFTEKKLENYIDGHNIDFVKGRVALDMEWNSKDQTFDRDLFAMRTYHECDIISVGIIITRSKSLNPLFKELGISQKYGASTTWMGKLLPRLDSRRHGGCPVLAIGITDACIEE